VIRLFQNLRPLAARSTPTAPRAPRSNSALARFVDAPPAPAGVADNDAVGCGWFDSSHELRSGLLVQEHLANDSVAAELPLADWLALSLWSKPVTLAL
jgi:hypothetical protein